jgi:PPP family 3-phenylpropionic acid transporter
VFLGFPFADSVVEVALLQALFLLLWVPVLPATEHVAIAETRGGGIDYGRVRMWGSISFILVSVAVGRLMDTDATAPIHAAGQALLLLLVVGALWLPRGRAAPNRAGFPLRRLWGIPGLAAVFIAAGCVQASHAMVYSFGSIYWGGLGLDGGTIGLLWAEGVLVEIGLFLVAGRIRAHIGPGGMLLFAGAAATARWAAMPFLESVAAIAVIQALHGLTFGFAHLGVMEFVARSVAERLTAGAIALYSMLVMGLAMGVSALLSGFLYERFGGDAFLAMAAVAALGALLAATACRPERGH